MAPVRERYCRYVSGAVIPFIRPLRHPRAHPSAPCAVRGAPFFAHALSGGGLGTARAAVRYAPGFAGEAPGRWPISSPGSGKASSGPRPRVGIPLAFDRPTDRLDPRGSVLHRRFSRRVRAPTRLHMEPRRRRARPCLRTLERSVASFVTRSNPRPSSVSSYENTEQCARKDWHDVSGRIRSAAFESLASARRTRGNRACDRDRRDGGGVSRPSSRQRQTLSRLQGNSAPGPVVPTTVGMEHLAPERRATESPATAWPHRRFAPGACGSDR